MSVTSDCAACGRDDEWNLSPVHSPPKEQEREHRLHSVIAHLHDGQCLECPVQLSLLLVHLIPKRLVVKGKLGDNLLQPPVLSALR